MEGLIATEKKPGIFERHVTDASAYQRILEQSFRQCRREITFLKRKYFLLEQLIKQGQRHFNAGWTDRKKKDLMRECAIFQNGLLADLENKYNDHADAVALHPELSYNEFLDRLQHLQKDWNDLQMTNQQLELQLLQTIIRQYPVSIV